MKLAVSVAMCCAFAFAVTPAQAQTYPARSVRIIVPFAPAGPTDNQARWAAQQLNAALGQTFIVENRPGAGGMSGTEVAVKSPPDGYTLLAGNPGPLTIAPIVRASVPYNTLRDLAPIVLVAKSASCLCAHPSLPVKGVRDFVAFAKARPGGINYGTPGVGTVGHLATELFATSAGVKLNHVPYKGAAQYTVDLIAGNIEVALNQFAISTPLVKAGKLRCLGVTSTQRTPLLPEIATMDEQGLKGFQSYNWNGMLAPAATPKAVIARLHETIAKALQTPEARNVFVSQGHEVAALGPDDYTAFLKAETAKWAQVAGKAGIAKQ